MEIFRQLQQHLPPFAFDIFKLCIWLLLLMLIFLPLERLCEQHSQKVVRKAFFTDLGYYFLNGILPRMLLILPLSMLVWGLHHVMPSGIDAFVTGMPLWLRFTAAVIVGEFGSYW